jgi:hypothetical protein
LILILKVAARPVPKPDQTAGIFLDRRDNNIGFVQFRTQAKLASTGLAAVCRGQHRRKVDLVPVGGAASDQDMVANLITVSVLQANAGRQEPIEARLVVARSRGRLSGLVLGFFGHLDLEIAHGFKLLGLFGRGISRRSVMQPAASRARM